MTRRRAPWVTSLQSPASQPTDRGRAARVGRRLTAALLVLACGSCGDDTDLVDPTAAALAAAVDIRAAGCKTVPFRGGGSALGGGLVVTAAHVVAGADTITVDGIDAQLLALDRVNDLAILGAVLPDRTPLELSTQPLAADGAGTVVVFRDDAATAAPAVIDAPVIVRILDIYHEEKIERPGYRVDAVIEAGDSGAVLVDAHGRAAGVFYARSRHTDGRAFATNVTALPALLADAARSPGIDTGDCV